VYIDTGYDKTQKAKPDNILSGLEHNFIDGDGNPNSSQDPNVGGMFDNSGHGSGTSGILIGGQVPQLGVPWPFCLLALAQFGDNFCDSRVLTCLPRETWLRDFSVRPCP
jgi:hypothetical protein